jgi:hypothetical protein
VRNIAFTEIINMFHPIEVPFGCAMLFNVVDLKEGVSIEDVELAVSSAGRYSRTPDLFPKKDR